ncbi:CHAT domain-containing protein [Streptomyces sp. NPDC051183]|uniref:CHAT domain-containing protein n=1 Tax=Streptomyces sp. NPDC051183 TaxID=3155165 RepID=UPI0034120925
MAADGNGPTYEERPHEDRPYGEHREPAEAARANGSVGDMLLRKYRSDPHHAGFFEGRLEARPEAWGPWLAATEPDCREPVIIAAQGLSICYRDRDRNIDAALFWAETHLRLARTLPTWFAPGHSRLGLGRDHYIGAALMGVASVETMRGAVERAYDLLLEAERHFDAERDVRGRDGAAGRPVAQRVLGIGDGREGLYRTLSRAAWLVGNEGEARRYHLLAIDHRDDDPTVYDEIDDLLLKGEFHLDSDRPDVALRHFQQALALAGSEEVQHLPAQVASNAHRRMAEAYGRLGTPRTALVMLDKARTLMADSGKQSFLALIEVSAAQVLRRSPRLGDPLEHLLRALEYDSLPAAPGDPHTWVAADGRRLRVADFNAAWPVVLDAAGILEERRRLSDACELLHLAAGIAEEVRSGAVDETSRIAVQEQRGKALLALARTQLALARESDAPDLADAAWKTVETLRARTFLDMVGEAALTPPADVPAALAEREASLLARRRGLRASARGEAEFWSSHRSVERQLAEVWRTMAALSPAGAEYAAVRQARPLSRPEVAEQLRARPGASGGRVVAVNLLFPDDEHLVFLAVDGTDRPVRVATSRVDRTRLARFAAANFGSASRVRELAADLEDLFHHELSEVVAPLADLCEPGDTLVVCPAGPVHNLPLGAVRLGQDVLLARNPLVISPSASLLRSRAPVERGRGGHVRAVFGDPTGDLAGARNEARELALRWGAAARIGERATADALLEALGSAATVHVAAHAAFTAEDPLASGIRMADRVLTAREILGVRATDLDLVTLSACESGIYHAGLSEDPMGLPRALLFAGAGSVLVSLWKVPDSAAYRFMTHFYAGLESTGSKAAALRSASLAVREEDGRLDRWAAFVLAGARL